MIYEKSLQIPSYRTRRIRRELSLYSDRDGALYCRGEHFRSTDEGIVMAEGADPVVPLPFGCVGLRLSKGHAERPFYEFSNGNLTGVFDLYNYITGPVNEALFFCDHEGVEHLITVSDTAVCYEYRQEGMKKTTIPGGSCACLAYERVFIADENRIRWTNALNPEEYSKSLQNGGYVDLPSPDGKILDLLSFQDKILLFRNRGITTLEVKGEPLSYSVKRIPGSYGETFRHTARLCGERAVFLTESGLCSFDGSRIKRIPDCGFSEIDLEKSEFHSASYQGIYYLAVTTKSGKKRVWVVDPERETGHFLSLTEPIVGGSYLLFCFRDKLYRLNKCGVPVGGEMAKLVCERTLLGLSSRQKYLDGVSFEGEGFLSIEAVSERGGAQRVFGRAGERLRFPVPVRGVGFSFRIETTCANVKIRSMTFDVREEDEA